MACCQDIFISSKYFMAVAGNGLYDPFFYRNAGEFFFKQYFTTAIYDQLPHGCDDLWKFVGADMRMCIV
jgi:hypothetical protein